MTKSELFEHILQTYQTQPEFPWEKFPEYAVFRHKNNRKWFALFCVVDGKNLGAKNSERVEILNVKTEPVLVKALLEKKGIFEAYHMSKTHWVSIALSSASDEDILALLDISFELTK